MKSLITVIVPQAKGAIMAIALFHFVFYLSSRRDLQPISVGVYEFLGLYDTAIPMVQAGAMLSMTIPILVFLFLQKFFLSGIDLSGSLK